MAAWTTSRNLSDLAASHLKNTGAPSFSFLPNNQAPGYCPLGASNLSSSGATSHKSTSKINFDEFEDFFKDEALEIDSPDFDSSMGMDTSLLTQADPSAFGCVICREFASGEKSITGSSVSHPFFTYHTQYLLNKKPTKLKATSLFPKPKHSEIMPFDFKTPSPDDIIIAKQKEAL